MPKSNQNDIIHTFSFIYELSKRSNKLKNIVNLNGLFYNCSSLISLPDISKWNTIKVTDMNGLFYNCSSLISIPDISNWNTNNVIDMHGLFYKCSSLISIPDISKWNTNNVINMSEIFYYCSSLSSLPNISQWDTSKVEDISDIFDRCRSLSTFPDISKWNTSKLIKKMGLPARISVPINDISETSQEKEKKLGVFYDCLSLASIPDLNNWNIEVLSKDDSKLYNCISLIYSPFEKNKF